MTANTTLIVGIIAAFTALIGYLTNAAVNRRSERVRRYADALNAVERYRQLPYNFARLHDETPETRSRLAELLGDTQATLAYHRRLLRLESPELGFAFDALVAKIRDNNHSYRKAALGRPKVQKDIEIELGGTFDFEECVERENCIVVMRKHLRIYKVFR